mgnify:CR=1 FL=1|jgi:hypothetical protein
MKQIKIITILFIALLSFSVNAQDKLNEKAIEQVKELNVKLGDEKLSPDQETKLTELYIEKLKAIKAVKKEVADEEEQKVKVKELYKKYAKLTQEILTKEQKIALKDFTNNK